MLDRDGVHTLRRMADELIYTVEKHLEVHPVDGREMALVRTKLQEAKMWMGQALGARPDDDYPEELRDLCAERQ